MTTAIFLAQRDNKIGIPVPENKGGRVAIDEATSWLQRFALASESADRLDYLVEAIDGRILAALPQLQADSTLRNELHASTRAHWKAFLAVVAREDFDVQTPLEVYDLARTLARRGFDMPVLLTVYRVAQQAAWNFITTTLDDDANADAELRSAVLLLFWPRVTRWLDATIETLIVTFTAEREQWQRGSIARRAATVKAIVARQAVDVDAATTALAYPLLDRHVGFVLWVDEFAPDADVQSLLDAGAGAVGAALQARQTLTVASGARALWCWSSGTRRSPGVMTVPRFVRVAIGSCHPGLPGFRRSHLEAIAAQWIGVRRDAEQTRYADVELACLAAGIVGEEGAAALVERELGELAAPDDGMARLRETVRLYLEFAGDARAAGEALNVHPNTVRYRVRQAEQLLGHSVDHRRVYLETALHVIDALGTRIL